MHGVQSSLEILQAYYNVTFRPMQKLRCYCEQNCIGKIKKKHFGKRMNAAKGLLMLERAEACLNGHFSELFSKMLALQQQNLRTGSDSRGSSDM
jgi:hypothetical protein